MYFAVRCCFFSKFNRNSNLVKSLLSGVIHLCNLVAQNPLANVFFVFHHFSGFQLQTSITRISGDPLPTSPSVIIL